MENQLIPQLENMNVPNQSELTAARHFLEKAIATEYAAAVLALSRIMADESLGAAVRMQAGLQLKNVLYSHEIDPEIEESRWLQLPENIRAEIKAHCCQALAAQDPIRHSAAQCVARVTCVEASLEAIGYICYDISVPNLMDNLEIFDVILPQLHHGQNKLVRLAAAKALLRILGGTRHIFESRVVNALIAASFMDEDIVVLLLRCLNTIMRLNYVDVVNANVVHGFISITSKALRGTDTMALHAIEFWSTVCKEEIKIKRDAAKSAERGLPVAANHCKFYARRAIRFLVLWLLQILERQEEGDDERKPHKAARLYLGLLSHATGNAMVKLVWPYVNHWIWRADWRKRKAAVTAFGSILDGPSPDSLEPLVTKAMPVITKLLRDSVPVVRASAAWSVGRMSDVLPEVLHEEQGYRSVYISTDHRDTRGIDSAVRRVFCPIP